MARANPSFAHRLGWRLEALGYDLVGGLLRLLPLDAASAFGGRVFRLIGPLTSEHRVAMAGTRIAFPEMAEEERRRIVAAHWDNLGRTAIEFVMMDRILGDPARVRATDGDPVVERARERRPTILVGGHFANWEAMTGAASLNGVELLVSYRAMNNPHVNARVVRARAEHGIHLHAPRGRGGARGLLEALESGRMLGMLADQRDNNGVEVTFFGRSVKWAPGPARMALAHGAAIIPIEVERLTGARFRVRPHPPIPVQATGDREGDVRRVTAAIAAFMEARIRERPEQWLWSHRRWAWEDYEMAGLKR